MTDIAKSSPNTYCTPGILLIVLLILFHAELSVVLQVATIVSSHFLDEDTWSWVIQSFLLGNTIDKNGTRISLEISSLQTGPTAMMTTAWVLVHARDEEDPSLSPVLC